jgi:hypothetical protein
MRKEAKAGFEIVDQAESRLLGVLCEVDDCFFEAVSACCPS